MKGGEQFLDLESTTYFMFDKLYINLRQSITIQKKNWCIEQIVVKFAYGYADTSSCTHKCVINKTIRHTYVLTPLESAIIENYFDY